MFCHARQLLFALLCVVVALTATAARCEQKAKSLFDGKTLDGWTVTDCKATVEDGAILLADGNGMVRTNDKYADFVLEWECKAVKESEYDSGVYVRFDVPYPKGRAWPARYQVNLRQGDEGNMKEIKGESKGHFKAGDWNRFKLTARGSTAELEMNGKAAWKADGIKEKEGYIGLQAEIPSGGQYRFREIKVTKLEP